MMGPGERRSALVALDFEFGVEKDSLRIILRGKRRDRIPQKCRRNAGHHASAGSVFLTTSSQYAIEYGEVCMVMECRSLNGCD